ncbi:MAG: hypothetical protein AAF125_04700 [Chloroflexota bacterium]
MSLRDLSFDDLLREINIHHQDPEWLDTHESIIRERLIHDGLYPKYHEAVTLTLKRIVPHFLHSPTHLRWQDLLDAFFQSMMDEHAHATEADETTHQSTNGLWYLRGISAVINGQVLRAYEDLIRAAQDATSDDAQADERIAAYNALLHLNTLQGNQPKYGLRRYYDRLARETQHASPRTRTLAFYALGRYDLHHHELDSARGNLLQAYDTMMEAFPHTPINTSIPHDIRLQMLKITVALATCSRLRGELDNAEFFMERAERYYIAGPSLTYYQAFVAHENGMIARDLGHFETAADHLSRAKYIFQTLQDVPMMTATKHSLGMILAYTKDHLRAHKLLIEAMREYDDRGDVINMVDVQHCLGYNYLLSEDYTKARQWLFRARTSAKTRINHSREVQAIYTKSIEESIDELNRITGDDDSISDVGNI